MLIASLREIRGSSLVWIDDPVAIVPMSTMHNDMMGETFLLKPWMGVCSDKSFMISKEEILTFGELKENLLEQYKRYISTNFEQHAPSDDSEEEGVRITASYLKQNNLLN
jgi:hypothetical protein